MTIYDFFITLLSPFGLEPVIIQPSLLIDKILSCTEWYHLLSIDIIFSTVVYLTISYGMLYICFILPFRYLQKWLNVPKRGGK